MWLRIVTICLCCASWLWGNAEGIKFLDMSLPEALKIAAKENKRVFVDCYTQSCTPCKYMAAKVFPLDECGSFMNPKYVSVAKDLDTPDSKYIRKEYGVMVFPTFLVLNPDGSLFCKLEGGATKTADAFIEKMEAAIAEGEMNSKFESGDRTPEFMKSYAEFLASKGSQKLGRVLNVYFTELAEDAVNSPSTVELGEYVSSVDSDSFKRLFGWRGELAMQVGAEKVQHMFSTILNADFANKRAMKMDFSSRMQLVEQLEKEKLITPSLLTSKMLFRQVVNNRDKAKGALILQEVHKVAESGFSKAQKQEAFAELSGIEQILPPADYSDVAKILQSIKY